MADDSAPDVDLLGDPWTELKDPRGRKRHKRTVQTAEIVSVLAATGMSQEHIAARVGISVPTLTQYYFRELERGPDFAMAMVDEAMYRKARDGNATAARYIRDRFETGRVKPGQRRPRAGALGAPKPGKKEAANLAAQSAHEGTGWDSLLKH